MPMPKALSATVPEPLEARAREIARRENRSLSNVVENALGVFTALPKELRDQLVARLSTGGPDDAALRDAAREMMFALARRRYEEARESLASSIRRRDAVPDAGLANLDGWTIVDRATAS
jgi:predicted transcriptional regulator